MIPRQQDQDRTISGTVPINDGFSLIITIIRSFRSNAEGFLNYRR
jgi:hypothetical protein